MTWNPSVYLGFAGERTRPAIELASRINVQDPKLVVDLGCGPGNSTAILAQRWPNARFIGVDNSPEMLATARKAPLNADWQRADLAAAPAAYYAMLSAHASTLDVWETEYLQALDGEDAVFNWVSGTALVPYREALGEDDRKEFLNAYRERLSRAHPRGANGKTLF